MLLKKFLLAFLVLSVVAGAAGAQEEPTSAQTFLRCALPVNTERGVHYEGGRGEDSLPWGPSAITVTPEGHLLVADSARTRLVEYADDCAVRHVLQLVGKVRGISDVEVTDEGYFVLDVAAPEPAVVQLDAAAQVLRRFPVPKDLAAGSPSLLVEEGQRVRLGLQGGAEAVPLAGGGGPISGEAAETGVHEQGVRLLAAVEAQRPTLTIGAEKISIESDVPVASFRVLGAVAKRHVYTSAIEVTEISGTLRVRESVYRITWDGKVDGVARGLFAEQHVFVPHRLAVDAGRDGVLALFTYPDRVEIHELVFSDPAGLAPRNPVGLELNVGPDEQVPEELDSGAATDSRCKVFPREIREIAEGYISNRTTLNEKNINGACAARASRAI